MRNLVISMAPLLIVFTMVAAGNIDQRLARWQTVKMPFNAVGLSTREHLMVEKLVEASRYLDDIFWRQSDPEALALYTRSGFTRIPLFGEYIGSPLSVCMAKSFKT